MPAVRSDARSWTHSRRTKSSRSTMPRSTSATGHPCSRQWDPSVRTQSSLRGLDGCRRLRSRRRPGDPSQRARHTMGLRERPSIWRVCRDALHRLRLRRHETHAVRRVRRDEPGLGLRALETRGRTRSRRRRRHRPHVMGVRPPWRQHGEDDFAARGEVDRRPTALRR